MNTLDPSDYATQQQIARNHERVRKLRDRTPDLITEDLCLVSQTIRTPAAVERAAPDNQSAFAF